MFNKWSYELAFSCVTPNLHPVIIINWVFQRKTKILQMHLHTCRVAWVWLSLNYITPSHWEISLILCFRILRALQMCVIDVLCKRTVLLKCWIANSSLHFISYRVNQRYITSKRIIVCERNAALTTLVGLLSMCLLLIYVLRLSHNE